MKLIASFDNPTYKNLHRLVDDARASRKQGKTLIDGPHLVAAYHEQVGLPEQLLISESGRNREDIRELIESHAGIDTIILKDALFKTLSGVMAPVGVAAVIPIPQESPAMITGNCVLLDALQDAGNVGSILRTSAAAGISDIYFGPGCAAAWSPRVLRAAQGAHFRLRIRESVNLEQFLGNYQGISLATIVMGGVSPQELNISGDVAWIFGSEGQGVRPQLSALASRLVTIQMAAKTESLNVAAAAAICLFSRRIHD